MLFFAVIFIPGRACGAGTVTGDFLLVDIQAREVSLGGIYSPFYARPGASTMNPACLQGIKNNYLVFSHYTSVFSSHYEQVQYAQPVSLSSCAGVYMMYSSNDTLYRTDSEGEPVEKIDNYDFIAGGTYSMAINEEYNAGVNLKLVGSKLYNDMNIGGVCNLGVLYRNYNKRYTLGADVENLGIGTAYFREKAVYPVLFRGGYGTEVYRYEEEYKISVFVEERIFLDATEGTETSFGMEASYLKFLTFRYGYIFGRDDGRVATGIGIKVRDLFIDYAYQPFFVSDNAHRITLKYMF